MSAFNALFLLSHISAYTQKCSIYDIPCVTSLTQNYANIINPGGTGFGSEPLDPMNLDSVKGDQEGVIYTYSDIEVLGLKNSLVQRVQFNKEEKRINLNFRVPCLTIIANYTARGYLQSKVPLNGEGKLIINLYDFENDMTIDYEIIKGKNDKDYIKLDHYLYWFDMRYQESSFESINKDDPVRATEAQEFIKREYRKLWQQYGRPIFNKFNDKVFETVKKFLFVKSVEDILYDY